MSEHQAPDQEREPSSPTGKGALFLSAVQVAERWDCSVRHVRNMIARGVLAAVKLGGMVRVRISDLEAFEAGSLIGASEKPPAQRAPRPKSAAVLKAPRPKGRSERQPTRPADPPKPPARPVDRELARGRKLLEDPEVAAVFEIEGLRYPKYLTEKDKSAVLRAYYHRDTYGTIDSPQPMVRPKVVLSRDKIEDMPPNAQETIKRRMGRKLRKMPDVAAALMILPVRLPAWMTADQIDCLRRAMIADGAGTLEAMAWLENPDATTLLWMQKPTQPK
ncbi:MAG TPA: helix-turn-helix domain-containing protein [Stellaceae bacterium]|nr:helix-turn-helix domain-containing protein [Stellaceae bacterium]